MRNVMTYDVNGRTRVEVEEQALLVYRKFIENEEAELPHSTTIESRPEVLVGDGSIVTWVGNVTILLNSGNS